jgi:prephenate dehydratase
MRGGVNVNRAKNEAKLMGESIRPPSESVKSNLQIMQHSIAGRIILPFMSVTESVSNKSQRSAHSFPRVSFQGALGAFSEMAIRQHWPEGALPIPQLSFADAVECALGGDADFAVIPVENVIAGPVHPALQALNATRDRFAECGQLKLNVRLCLMAPAGSHIEALRVVLSHPMALAQCNNFFTQHRWLTPVVHNDTATAAQDVAAGQFPNAAAIASEAAASRYHLEILATDIQDIRENWTRFVILTSR